MAPAATGWPIHVLIQTNPFSLILSPDPRVPDQIYLGSVHRCINSYCARKRINKNVCADSDRAAGMQKLWRFGAQSPNHAFASLTGDNVRKLAINQPTSILNAITRHFKQTALLQYIPLCTHLIIMLLSRQFFFLPARTSLPSPTRSFKCSPSRL